MSNPLNLSQYHNNENYNKSKSDFSPIWKFVIRYGIVIVLTIFILGISTVIWKYGFKNILNDGNRGIFLWLSIGFVGTFTLIPLITIFIKLKKKEQEENDVLEYIMIITLIICLLLFGPMLMSSLQYLVNQWWKITLDVTKSWMLFIPLVFQAGITAISFILLSIPDINSEEASYAKKNIAVAIGGGLGFVITLTYNLIVMGQTHFVPNTSWFARISMIVLSAITWLFMFMFNLRDKDEEKGDFFIRDGLFLPSILIGALGTVVGIAIIVICLLAATFVLNIGSDGSKTVGKGKIKDSCGREVGDVEIKQY